MCGTSSGIAIIVRNVLRRFVTLAKTHALLAETANGTGSRHATLRLRQSRGGCVGKRALGAPSEAEGDNIHDAKTGLDHADR